MKNLLPSDSIKLLEETIESDYQEPGTKNSKEDNITSF